jgi:hypothetical protein
MILLIVAFYWWELVGESHALDDVHLWFVVTVFAWFSVN